MTHQVYNFLHVLGHRLVSIARTIINMYGLVGQFEQHGTIVLQFRMLSNIAPYLLEVLMVVIAYLDVLRADSRWAHDDI